MKTSVKLACHLGCPDLRASCWRGFCLPPAKSQNGPGVAPERTRNSAEFVATDNVLSWEINLFQRSRKLEHPRSVKFRSQNSRLFGKSKKNCWRTWTRSTNTRQMNSFQTDSLFPRTDSHTWFHEAIRSSCIHHTRNRLSWQLQNAKCKYGWPPQIIEKHVKAPDWILGARPTCLSRVQRSSRMTVRPLTIVMKPRSLTRPSLMSFTHL